jgi:drug/metabolite transporter (DMT)-like permease
MNTGENTKGIMFAVLTGLCWSVVTIALKIVLIEMDPFTIVWFRFALAFSILFLYFLLISPSKLSIFKKPPLLLIIAALGLAFNYYGIIKGVDYTTPTTTQLVIQFGPILLGISGFIIYKEKLTGKHVAGFLVAVTGLLLFYYKQTDEIVLQISSFNKGISWILFAGFTWAVYSVFQKHLVRTYPVLQLNLIIYGLPVLLYLPVTDFQSLGSITPVTWAVLIFLGLNTLIAYIFMALSLKHLEANKVSIILVMNPVITFFIMMFLEHIHFTRVEAERFTAISLIGAGMVVAGAAIVVGFRTKKRRND